MDLRGNTQGILMLLDIDISMRFYEKSTYPKSMNKGRMATPYCAHMNFGSMFVVSSLSLFVKNV